MYGNKFQEIFEKIKINDILKKNINEDDVYHIKDNMYTLDFWINEYLLEHINTINLKKDYSDTNILGIISYMMETTLGFLLYTTYIKHNLNRTKNNTIDDLSVLYDIYCIDVLNLDKTYAKKMKKLLKDMEIEFEDILKLWIEIDDNKRFFKI